MSTRRILILGGYGTFGSRIVRLLAKHKRWALVVAGRSKVKAEAFTRSLGDDQVAALALDRDAVNAETLRALDLWLVIDASGPFQGERAQGYPVVRAALEAGLHYIDIADALTFVREIDRFDESAKARGLTVISGASSVPTLSSAVIAECAAGLDAPMEVEIAISSSNQATLGRSVHAALLSYAGKPIRVRRFGTRREIAGLQDWQRIDIRVPGHAPLRGRLVAPCEVPDLDLLPARYPKLRKVIFRAGTELGILNRGAGLLSLLVSSRLLNSLSPFAGLASRAFGLLHGFGTSRSGMVVTVTSRAGESWERRRWNVLAEDGDGLWVPALAAALLTEKLDRGGLAAGARPGIDVLSLAEFRDAFAPFKIEDATETEAIGPSPFRQWLGGATAELPPAIRALHDDPLERSASGTVTVTRGTHPIARLMCRMLGFPASGTDLPLRVEFEPRGSGEIWRRIFSSSTFTSHLKPWPGRTGAMRECVGPLAYGFRLETDAQGLRMVFERWWLFGIPLPAALGPRVKAAQWQEGDDYGFSVDVAGIGIGRVIGYRGRLRLNPDVV
jgi:NAD(P)-dependent dehydrogenase (short-subunit alcohol dehydrogenase family)